MKEKTICCMDCKFNPHSRYYESKFPACQNSAKVFDSGILNEIMLIREHIVSTELVQYPDKEKLKKLTDELTWRESRYNTDYREFMERCKQGCMR